MTETRCNEDPFRESNQMTVFILEKKTETGDNVNVEFNVNIDQNVVRKMIDFGICEINKEPEKINITLKFCKHLISYDGKWLDQQAAEISRDPNISPLTIDLGFSLIILSAYLGLTLQESKDQMEELLPVAHGLLQVLNGLSFQYNNR
jgi:hypothetical protein